MINRLLFIKCTLSIAAGGAIGAVSRYWCAEFIHFFFERGFPVGTLIVNVVGSFLMGFLSLYLFNKVSFGVEWRSFILIGILGSFTTFSTFSLDVINLFALGHIWFACLNIVMSLFLCLGAAGLGMWIAH